MNRNRKALPMILLLITPMLLTAQYNTSYGTSAGNSGNYNSSFGHYAGDVVTGFRNTFIGYYAGKVTTIGDNNVFCGALNGYSNTTGDNNTYLGFRVCVLATTACNNTSIGYKSGTFISSGSYNTFLGAHAGYSTSTGQRNVYLGYSAGYYSTGSDNLFIGYQAGTSETGSNKLYIDNSSSTSPLIYGEFDNNFVTINGKLGIGTTEFGDAELAVNGTVMAKEIVITVDDFPDYVFEDDYELLSLNELESYIKANKHLPGIKSRKKAIEEGVPLGELNTQLLEKIEELTLHVIDLDKKASSINESGEDILQKLRASNTIN